MTNLQDIPILKQSGMAAGPGQAVQVGISPSVTTTTTAARTRFTPLERKCYFNDELSLAHLLPEVGYRCPK